MIDRRTPSPNTASWTLAVLFLTNVLNIGDRTLLGVVTEPVRLDLGLSDTQMSLANGFLFVVFNLVVGIFIARLVDVGNRKLILACGVIVWSFATAVTGLAQDFATLSLARVCVGAGEATAFPVAMSLIPDLFQPSARGKAVAVFQSSGMIGIVGGTILAGMLAGSIGWRTMFGICGAGGVIVALLLLAFVSEPERERQPQPLQRRYFASLVAACRRVLGFPGLMSLGLGFGISGMTGAVLGAWGAAFLQRTHHVPLADVGLLIGPAVGGGGILGTLASGIIADRLLRRRGLPSDMLNLPLTVLPLAAPFIIGFVIAPTPGLAMASAFIMNFLLAAAFTPCVSCAIELVGSGDRAITSTMMLASSGVIGSGMGPFVVGLLSDAFAPTLGQESLRYAMGAITLAPLVAAALLLVARQRSARFVILQNQNEGRGREV